MEGMEEFEIGFQVLTASGPVQASGIPVAIYSLYNNSSAAGGGITRLYSGIAPDSQQIIFAFNEGAANVNAVHSLAGGQGVVFPVGCYVELFNDDYVTVAYQVVRA